MSQDLYHCRVRVSDLEDETLALREQHQLRLKALDSERAKALSDFEGLKTKYHELLETRFQVSHGLLSQLSDDRLSDIETQLF